MTACSRNPAARRPALLLPALAMAALFPAGCTGLAPPQPSANPFAGAWSTAERQQIAFRDDTVVINPAGGPPTPLGPAACDGSFRFAYAKKSRATLLALTPAQPDLRRRLEARLTQPEYRVAELSCGEGGTTYVLLGERELLAIDRDRDIAAVRTLSR